MEGIFSGGGNEQIFLAGGEDLGMLTGISKQASKNIFLTISLHCVKVKMKEKKLLRRLCPTFKH